MALFTPNINVDNDPLKVDGSAVTQPVSGTFYQTTQPVSGTFWQTTQPVSGTIAVTESGASTATTLAQVVLSANTNATALVANAARLGAIIFIPTASVGNPVYIKFGTTASSTSFTYKMVSANSTVEIPKAWLGRIDVISISAQSINVTEF